MSEKDQKKPTMATIIETCKMCKDIVIATPSAFIDQCEVCGHCYDARAACGCDSHFAVCGCNNHLIVHCPSCHGVHLNLLEGAPDNSKSLYLCGCGRKFFHSESVPIATIAPRSISAIPASIRDEYECQKTKNINALLGLTNIPQLPVLLIEAETCGEAWEKAVEAVWTKGVDAEQHYGDQWSKEATVLINIHNPLAEPRFSKKDSTTTPMMLMGEDRKKPYREKQYVKDLLDGDMDHRVLEGVESYTYHERLWAWGIKNPSHEELLKKLKKPTIHFAEVGKYYSFDIFQCVDQIALLLQKAKEEPISRKLQAVTWQPHKDMLISGAPCLQRIWVRILEGKYLVLETMWRSRDLYKAWGSNTVGMTEIGKYLADQLNLTLVQYTDFSNSLHIYKSDYDQVERHFEILKKRTEESEPSL